MPTAVLTAHAQAPGIVTRRTRRLGDSMFRHVAMFTFVDDITDDHMARIGDGLAALRQAIPEIHSFHFGPDAGLAEDNHDYVVVADFASVEAYAVYRDHPVHRQLIVDVIRPVLAERVAVQYQID
jgi:hypothetical protein